MMFEFRGQASRVMVKGAGSCIGDLTLGCRTKRTLIVHVRVIKVGRTYNDADNLCTRYLGMPKHVEPAAETKSWDTLHLTLLLCEVAQRYRQAHPSTLQSSDTHHLYAQVVSHLVLLAAGTSYLHVAIGACNGRHHARLALAGLASLPGSAASDFLWRGWVAARLLHTRHAVAHEGT